MRIVTEMLMYKTDIDIKRIVKTSVRKESAKMERCSLHVPLKLADLFSRFADGISSRGSSFSQAPF